MTVEAISSLGSFATRGAEATSSTSPAGMLGGAASAATPQGPDFASVLAEVAAGGLQTIRAGEAAALGGLQGKTSVQQVVEAVMSAEQTLHAAIAVRDKVVAAYQEITRMAI
jgi:flagellar hook-basal body complex protein FliE